MAQKLPHLLLFNPDQWRGDTLGFVGHQAVQTPVLDRLVEEEGIGFTQAYCQNPVCTPSRCSFMTGWYPHVRGHRTMYHMLQPEEPCLLKILKDAGYFVWWGGKNDLLPGQNDNSAYVDKKFWPDDATWKRWGRNPGPNTHNTANEWRGPKGGDNYYSFYAGELRDPAGTPYTDADWAWTLGAVDFIRDYDGDQPLCLYLPLGYPHPPYGVEEPWFSITDRSQVPPRVPTPSDWSKKPSINRGIHDILQMDGWSEERWNELRAVYYGMCTRQDHLFGLVLDALKEKNLYDDTAAFLFSDHGDFTGDYGLVEKTQNTFEDCLTRVPFVYKPPREQRGQTGASDALVELVDLTATIYDLTGIEPGYTNFGKSLLPLARGETKEHRDAVFCEGGRLDGEFHASESASNSYQNPEGLYYPRACQQEKIPEHTKAAMCRTEHFKYVRRHYETDELYDLQADPGELDNRIEDPALAGVLTELKERMLSWYMETADAVPFDGDERNF